ncbi:hypothetical protein ACOME3_007481 [Neoechinorhynchus agilis]
MKKQANAAPVGAFKSPLRRVDDKCLTSDLRKEIEDLEKELLELGSANDVECDESRRYRDLLHEYNDIKDVAQILLGQIASIDQCSIKQVSERFGIGDND